MKRSLRTHLLLLSVVCLAVVVGGTRLLSQFIARQYVINHVERTMVATLQQCQPWLPDETRFRACAIGITRGTIFETFSLNLTLCPATTAWCAGLHEARRWRALTDHGGADIEHVNARIDGHDWLVFRTQAQPADTVLMIRQSQIDSFIDDIWNIRDRVFLYIIPLSLLAMVCMALFMIAQLMRPLRQVKATISRLTSSNLSDPVDIVNPYREFEEVIAAFEDLRGRLHTSFLQSQRFAADASHELRTPLTILRGHAEQAIADLPTGSRTQVRLRMMEEEIGRLSDVTEKLLLLSRADAQAVKLDLSPVNFSEFLQELVSDAGMFDAKLAITAQIEPDIIWHCDLQLIRQLVYNLYTNAVNYNISDGWIHFKASQAGGSLELTLENPAQGFTPELTAKAFERFHRGDASRTREIDGQGLGLSLCREIAHLHQGKMTLTTNGHDIVCARLTAPLAI